MKTHFAATVVLSLLLTLAAPAFAGNVLYTNGPINGTITAYAVNYGYQVSDSFTVAASTVTGFDAGIWVYPGDTPLTVDWAIGTSAFTGNIASGTASLSNSLYCSSCGILGQYDIYTSTASGLNVALGAGTYWLTLDAATTALGDVMYWDINAGPSQAVQNTLGVVPSEAFTVYGSSTPEPGTLVMFGSGIVGLAGLLRRKLTA